MKEKRVSMFKVRFLFFLAFITNSFMVSADLLEIEIQGVKKDGILNLVIYDSKETFETYKIDKSKPQPGIQKSLIKRVSKGVYTDAFEIPAGTYAISLFIDSNENEEFDTNFLGLPTEQYGFSNNAMGRFGPPQFEPASFILDGYRKIIIDL
jgi:uncharacterized protein (DUF2141 family)